MKEIKAVLIMLLILLSIGGIIIGAKYLLHQKQGDVTFPLTHTVVLDEKEYTSYIYPGIVANKYIYSVKDENNATIIQLSLKQAKIVALNKDWFDEIHAYDKHF